MKAPYTITLTVSLNDKRKRLSNFDVRSMVGPEINDQILTEPRQFGGPRDRTVELDIDPSVLAGRSIAEVLQQLAALGYRLRSEKEEEASLAKIGPNLVQIGSGSL